MIQSSLQTLLTHVNTTETIFSNRLELVAIANGAAASNKTCSFLLKFASFSSDGFHFVLESLLTFKEIKTAFNERRDGDIVSRLMKTLWRSAGSLQPNAALPRVSDLAD